MAVFQEPEEKLVEDILKSLDTKKSTGGAMPGVDDILAELGIAVPPPVFSPAAPQKKNINKKDGMAAPQQQDTKEQAERPAPHIPPRMALRFEEPADRKPAQGGEASSQVQDYFQELSQRRDESGRIKSGKQLKKEARRQEKAENKRRRAQEREDTALLEEALAQDAMQEEAVRAQAPAARPPVQEAAQAAPAFEPAENKDAKPEKEKGDTLERIAVTREAAPPQEAVSFQQPDMDDTREFVLDIEEAAVKYPEEPAQEPSEEEGARLNGFFEEEQFKKFFTSRVGTMAQEEEPGKKPWFHLRRGRQRIEDDGEAFVDFDDQEWEEEAPQQDAEDDIVEDYNTPADAEPILQDLKGMRRGLLLRVVLTGVFAAALLYLGLSANGAVPALPGVSAKQPMLFLLVQTALLLGACLISFRSVVGGIGGLWGEATADTLTALGAAAALGQLLVCFIDVSGYDPASVTIFAPAAVLGLCLNALGKWMFSRTMLRNFELSTAQDEYAAAYLVDESRMTHKVTQGLAEPEPRLLVSRPTALVKGFLKQSFSERASDRLAKKLSFAVLGVSVLCCGLSWVFSGDIKTGLTAFAAAACMGGPLAATLAAALPNTLMQQAAAQVGAVIPGWSAMEELGSANVVMAGVRDLFPAGRVRLGGIKTFSKERIDLAILYAASILVEGCSTLRDIFLQVIEGNTGMLYQVENLTRETGCGFEGWIEHNRVIVGNRQMMQNHEIEIPSMDYEQRYTKDGKKPIYLAVSGKLFGMFLVSYQADPEVEGILQRLDAGGISLVVRSEDFSVTAELIETVYGLRPGGVKVLTAEDERALEPCLTYLPESEGAMTHIGTFTSFVGGLRAASAGASAEKLAGILMASASALGLALTLLLTITQGLSSLTLPAVVLFQLAWLVLTAAGPLFKKYQ